MYGNKIIISLMNSPNDKLKRTSKENQESKASENHPLSFINKCLNQ